MTKNCHKYLQLEQNFIFFKIKNGTAIFGIYHKTPMDERLSLSLQPSNDNDHSVFVRVIFSLLDPAPEDQNQRVHYPDPPHWVKNGSETLLVVSGSASSFCVPCSPSPPLKGRSMLSTASTRKIFPGKAS